MPFRRAQTNRSRNGITSNSMKLTLQLLDRGLVLGELLVHVVLALAGDDLGGAGAAALLVRLRVV